MTGKKKSEILTQILYHRSHTAQWVTRSSHAGIANSLYIFLFSNQGCRPTFNWSPEIPSLPADYPTRNDTHLCSVASVYHACFSLSQEPSEEILRHLPHPHPQLSVQHEPLGTHISAECTSFSCPTILWMFTLQAYTFFKSITLLTQLLNFTA